MTHFIQPGALGEARDGGRAPPDFWLRSERPTRNPRFFRRLRRSREGARLSLRSSAGGCDVEGRSPANSRYAAPHCGQWIAHVHYPTLAHVSAVGDARDQSRGIQQRFDDTARILPSPRRRGPHRAYFTNSPSRIGRISSQRFAMSGLCVTSTTAWPFSFARRVRRSNTIAEFFWSRLPVGSSARMIAG
jgi:hypothetical protein